MIAMFIIFVIVADVVIHWFTVMQQGWLFTVLVNIGMIAAGVSLYQLNKHNINWKNWAIIRKKHSKKHWKKLVYQASQFTGNLNGEDQELIKADFIIMLISIGYLLTIIPGLFSGLLGFAMMLTGFNKSNTNSLL